MNVDDRDEKQILKNQQKEYAGADDLLRKWRRRQVNVSRISHSLIDMRKVPARRIYIFFSFTNGADKQ